VKSAERSISTGPIATWRAVAGSNPCRRVREGVQRGLLNSRPGIRSKLVARACCSCRSSDSFTRRSAHSRHRRGDRETARRRRIRASIRQRRDRRRTPEGEWGLSRHVASGSRQLSIARRRMTRNGYRAAPRRFETMSVLLSEEYDPALAQVGTSPSILSYCVAQHCFNWAMHGARMRRDPSSSEARTGIRHG